MSNQRMALSLTERKIGRRRENKPDDMRARPRHKIIPPHKKANLSENGIGRVFQSHVPEAK
jgi:hypothetical protein